MAKDTGIERDAKIAKLMEMGGAAVKDAEKALDENDGEVHCAAAQLYGKIPRKVTDSSFSKSSCLEKHEGVPVDFAASKLEYTPVQTNIETRGSKSASKSEYVNACKPKGR